jgi:transglutaminase-like putative cysteine protease
MITESSQYLKPTEIIDSDSREIVNYARRAIKDANADPVSKAIALYYAVRDPIWYNPYLPFYRAEHYRASRVLKNGVGFCVPKASLLCALGRACGIPSRVGFADVRNHLATKQLLEFLGTDVFVYHGFVEFFLNDNWVKATPAFNIELCEKHKVIPLEFNGQEDSIFHAYNTEKKQFMEYQAFHGTYADIPVDDIVSAWQQAYGDDRVRQWIASYEKRDGISDRDFTTEEVI